MAQQSAVTHSFWSKDRLRLAVLLLVLFELLSFFGWLAPSLGNVITALLIAGFLLISLYDLRLGVAAMVVELAIGSHGYLFSFQYQGLAVSVRIAFFLTLCAVALLRAVQNKEVPIVGSFLFKPLLLMSLAVLYAVIRGYAAGNGFSNVFFDANAFLFFGAAFPLWQAIRSKEDLYALAKYGLLGVLASTAKVLLLVYMFSHKLWWALPETYRWIRDTRIGELTQVTDSFFRIFFQSQIYAVIAFFVLLAFAVSLLEDRPLKTSFQDRGFLLKGAALTALMASILVSLSRSNWMGMVAAFIVCPLLAYQARWPVWSWLKQSVSACALTVIAAIALIAVLVLIPFPPNNGQFSASLFGSRALTFDQEAGAGSRWALLPPLWKAITEQPLLGQGFGKEVTYRTQDPRLLAQHPNGEYTTFNFEWGYHDLWLKFGLIALVAYAYLLFELIRRGWQALRTLPSGLDQTLVFGLLAGLFALLVTHTTSPYLNHPLGISYLLLYGLCVDIVFMRAKTIDRS